MIGPRTEWGIVMKTALLASLLTIGLGTALATTTDELKIVVGGSTCIITDNGPTSGTCGTMTADTNGTAGTIAVSGDIGGWEILAQSGSSLSPSVTPFGLDVASLTASCIGTACSANELDIYYSDRNFTQAVSTFNTAYSLTSAITGTGSTSEGAWYSAGNGIFATTSLIGMVGPFTSTGSGTMSGGGPAGPAAYSLTLEEVFTASGTGADFSVDGNITGNVPEPASLLLLGGCLLVVGRKLAARLA